MSTEAEPKRDTTNDVYPIYQFIYPDKGGYTGFSIDIWDVRKLDVKSCVFVSNWDSNRFGGRAKECVIEARFFVFGVMLKQIFTGKYSIKNAMNFAKKLGEKWKVPMDMITQRDRTLLNSGANHVHIDDVVDSKIKRLL